MLKTACMSPFSFPPDVHFFPGVPPPAEDVRDVGFERFVPLYDSYLNRKCASDLGEANAYKCFVPRLL
jgi:hypothetical protein